jgi:hypothetical protein
MIGFFDCNMDVHVGWWMVLDFLTATEQFVFVFFLPFFLSVYLFSFFSLSSLAAACSVFSYQIWSCKSYFMCLIALPIDYLFVILS